MRVGLLNKPYLLHNVRLKPTNTQSRFWLLQTQPLHRNVATSKPLQQTKEPQSQTRLQIRPEEAESIKPESFQGPPKAKNDERPKTDGLLSEQTVSNKEQRKADWAIIKEMSRYLWPKVRAAYSKVFNLLLTNILG